MWHTSVYLPCSDSDQVTFVQFYFFKKLLAVEKIFIFFQKSIYSKFTNTHDYVLDTLYIFHCDRLELRNFI